MLEELDRSLAAGGGTDPAAARKRMRRAGP